MGKKAENNIIHREKDGSATYPSTMILETFGPSGS